MQLFISDEFSKNWKNVKIQDTRIVNQIRKVLRWKTWYTFYLQNTNWTIERMQVKILEIWKIINWEIEKIQQAPEKKCEKTIVQSILNKASKMELIVQKLAEIGIDKILFIKTSRSKFTELKWNKLERLDKIAIEATEQSFGWKIPKIEFIKSFEQIQWKKFVLDFDGVHYKQAENSEIDCLIIWPEWWFDEKDYENIWNFEKINLWEKVLRAETAAIIGAFIINT